MVVEHLGSTKRAELKQVSPWLPNAGNLESDFTSCDPESTSDWSRKPYREHDRRGANDDNSNNYRLYHTYREFAVYINPDSKQHIKSFE